MKLTKDQITLYRALDVFNWNDDTEKELVGVMERGTRFDWDLPKQPSKTKLKELLTQFNQKYIDFEYKKYTDYYQAFMAIIKGEIEEFNITHLQEALGISPYIIYSQGWSKIMFPKIKALIEGTDHDFTHMPKILWHKKLKLGRKFGQGKQGNLMWYNSDFLDVPADNYHQIDMNGAYLYWLTQPLPCRTPSPNTLSQPLYVTSKTISFYNPEIKKQEVTHLPLKPIPQFKYFSSIYLLMKYSPVNATMKKLYLSTIGYMSCSKFGSQITLYIWYKQQQRMHQIKKELIEAGCTPIKIHTDSIGWVGPKDVKLPSVTMGEGLGEWKFEAEDCIIQGDSPCSYQLIDQDGVVAKVRGGYNSDIPEFNP